MLAVIRPDILCAHLLQCFYLLHQRAHQFIDICLLTGNLPKRDRVRRVGDKNRLVDVQSDTCDRVFEFVAEDGVLYQYSGNLLVLPVYIVGPLDG